MKRMRIAVSAITTEGQVKKVNEDSLTYKIIEIDNEYYGVFAVADGVGGCKRGDVASNLAIRNIEEWWENNFRRNIDNIEIIIDSLIESFKKSNNELIALAENYGGKIATTLSVLIIYKGIFYIVHIGDSRVYRYRGLFNGVLSQLTRDDSCIIEKNLNGNIIKKAVLTQCLGNKEQCRPFCKSEALQKNDIFLLCSDGIYKTIKATELRTIIRRGKYDIKELCEDLVKTAMDKGERDNITAMVIKIVK